MSRWSRARIRVAGRSRSPAAQNVVDVLSATETAIEKVPVDVPVPATRDEHVLLCRS
jgi:hypothetical protein